MTPPRLRRHALRNVAAWEGRVARGPVVVLFGEGEGGVGYSVGRRIGNAVTRNLVRRRLRSAVRGARRGVPEGKCLVVARPGCETMAYEELARCVEECFEELYDGHHRPRGT